MQVPTWLDGYSASVTVCDADGTILYMNRLAARTFAADGGSALVGQSLFACHPAGAAAELRRLLTTHEPNSYTIEKKGQRKLISQAPWWHEDGSYGGIIEVSMVLPAVLPHFVRDSGGPAPTP